MFCFNFNCQTRMMQMRKTLISMVVKTVDWCNTGGIQKVFSLTYLLKKKR